MRDYEETEPIILSVSEAEEISIKVCLTLVLPQFFGPGLGNKT